MSKSQLARLSDQVPEIKRLQERVVELEGLLAQMREPITEGATPLADALREIQSDCEAVANDDSISIAERRTWRAIAHKCNNALNRALAPAPVEPKEE